MVRLNRHGCIPALWMAVLSGGVLMAQAGPGPFDQGAFTDLQRVGSPINSEHWESMGSLSYDKLWIYFVSNRPPSVGSEWCVDLWVARRGSVDEPFGEPTNQGILRHVNSVADECTPHISVDDTVLMLYSDRHAPGSGDYDIYVSTRDDPGADFGPPVSFSAAYPTSGVGSAYSEFGQSISCDRLAVYFSSDRPGGKGGFDLYVATRDSPGGLFDTVRNLGAVNTSAHEFSPIVSGDNTTLFFSDYIAPFRPGGLGEGDIWMVTRASADEDWENARARNLGWPINSRYADFDFFVSHDWPAEGSSIWFTTDRPRSRRGNANCSQSIFADDIWDADIYTGTWIPAKPFRRGDADGDGASSLTDAVFILRYLFEGDQAPSCLKAADVTDSGSLDLTDPVYLLAHMFGDGQAPPEPFAACGPDPTADLYTLSCNSYPPCRQ